MSYVKKSYLLQHMSIYHNVGTLVNSRGSNVSGKIGMPSQDYDMVSVVTAAEARLSSHGILSNQMCRSGSSNVIFPGAQFNASLKSPDFLMKTPGKNDSGLLRAFPTEIALPLKSHEALSTRMPMTCSSDILHGKTRTLTKHRDICEQRKAFGRHLLSSETDAADYNGSTFSCSLIKRSDVLSRMFSIPTAAEGYGRVRVLSGDICSTTIKSPSVLCSEVPEKKNESVERETTSIKSSCMLPITNEITKNYSIESKIPFFYDVPRYNIDQPVTVVAIENSFPTAKITSNFLSASSKFFTSSRSPRSYCYPSS